MAPRHIDMETDTLKGIGMWRKQINSSHAPWSIVQHLLKTPQKLPLISSLRLSFLFTIEQKQNAAIFRVPAEHRI